jgi:integrase/recombinase XerD
LRAATHEALFGLLATTGLRIGEAIGLERGDIDFDAQLITIRQTKLDRIRLVPLHPTVTEPLGRYREQRDRLCPDPRSSAFFLSNVGGYCTLPLQQRREVVQHLPDLPDVRHHR